MRLRIRIQEASEYGSGFGSGSTTLVTINVSDPHLLLCGSGSQLFSIWIRIQGGGTQKEQIKFKKIYHKSLIQICRRRPFLTFPAQAPVPPSRPPSPRSPRRRPPPPPRHPTTTPSTGTLTATRRRSSRPFSHPRLPRPPTSTRPPTFTRPPTTGTTRPPTRLLLVVLVLIILLLLLLLLLLVLVLVVLLILVLLLVVLLFLLFVVLVLPLLLVLVLALLLLLLLVVVLLLGHVLLLEQRKSVKIITQNLLIELSKKLVKSPKFGNIYLILMRENFFMCMSNLSTWIQCLGSIFIESGSSQKSQSGSKLFLNTIRKNLKLLHNYNIFSSKEVN